MIVLSTSERALGEIATKAGSPRLGGEKVRLIDVPASEFGSQGVFDRKIETGDVSTPLEVIKDLADTLATSARRYQGHAFVAFLRKLVRDQDWEAKARYYKTQFEHEVTAPASTAVYRIRSNFAIIWAAGALAIDYRVLPWRKTRLRKAVEKCFHRALSALQNLETIKLADQHTSADLLETLNEKLRQSELCVITPRKKVSEDEMVSRQKADGFIIDGVTYIKQGRLKAWFPDKPSQMALRQMGIFHSTRSDTPTVTKKVAGIVGKPRYYAINASALERSA